MKRRLKVSGRFVKVQNRLLTVINSVPILKKAVTNIRSARAVKSLSTKVLKSKKLIELIFKDVPREVHEVRPYLRTQRKNFENWGKGLTSPSTIRPMTVKSKTKADRARTPS